MNETPIYKAPTIAQVVDHQTSNISATMNTLVILFGLWFTFGANAMHDQTLEPRSYLEPPGCKDAIGYAFCVPDCLETGTKIDDCFMSCGEFNSILSWEATGREGGTTLTRLAYV